MKKQSSSSRRTETKTETQRETEREEWTQRARERREERGWPLAWQSLEHMPSSLSGVYVSVKSTGFLQPLLLAFFFIFCLLCSVSRSLLGFRFRLWLSVVLVGLFAFSSFSCCYCSNLFCLDCERKIQAFVCGNWVSFGVGGLKVSRRRGRGGLWGRGGDVRFRN